MARPRLRETGGRWSMAQIIGEAGVSLAVARTLLRRGFPLSSPPGENDVVRIKVAAALVDAPRPSGLTNDEALSIVAERDQQALRMTDDIVRAKQVDEGAMLLVFPSEVVLARTLIRVMATVEDHPNEAMLLLPVGGWVAALPSRSAAGP